jgi:hypothetical protein
MVKRLLMARKEKEKEIEETVMTKELREKLKKELYSGKSSSDSVPEEIVCFINLISIFFVCL